MRWLLTRAVIDELLQYGLLIDTTDNAAVAKAMIAHPGIRHELIKLCTFLVSLRPKIVEGRKLLIKSCWNCLRIPDPMTRMLSQLTVAVFVDVYPTPADVIHQLYASLISAGKDNRGGIDALSQSTCSCPRSQDDCLLTCI